MKKTIIFDVQVLQTPALERGMGQYILALLNSLHQTLYKPRSSKKDVVLIISSHLKDTKELTESLFGKFPNFKIVELPLIDLARQKNTKTGLAHNKQVLNSWIAEEGLNNSTFVISSVFQVEIYSVFPDHVYKTAIAYDVIPLQLFEQYKNKMRWEDYLNRFTQIYAADKLLCISKTTSDDLQVYVGVPPEKLAVIDGGPGVFSRFTKPALSPKQKFILMPTGNDLRKNNRIAVIGFENFRQTNPGYILLITSYFTDEERADLNKLSPGLMFTGSVTNDELAWYYRHCQALLFPSLYEGLGMPIIEAMKFKKPVIASKIDAFLEISTDAPYYFNPWDPQSITVSLLMAMEDVNFTSRTDKYQTVIDYYTWDNTAQKLLEAIEHKDLMVIHNERLKVAIAGPNSSGASAVGKFMAVLHPTLQQYFDIEYFFESSSVDRELRPDILSHVVQCHNIRDLTDKKIAEFDLIIYHIGNSNHHTLTAARALLHPGIVILHDLNLENIFNDLLDKRIIDKNRYILEEKLNKGNNARFVSSLLSRQKAIITHSRFAEGAVKASIVAEQSPEIRLANLCVETPRFLRRVTEDIFTIGLAGILANIKGLEVIEEIAKDPAFELDKILLFGLNFAEKGALDRLRLMSNVEVATDLTDYQFQQNLKRMSVFVNYRTHYQGEASYSTLESMRYGIPVIVRGDFGWYAELPDEAVIKVSTINSLKAEIAKLKTDPERLNKISNLARETTESAYSPRKYSLNLFNLAESLMEKADK